jgi:large subunit ribosomal protein L24
MSKSKKPGKQRKKRFQAKKHEKQKFMSAHLSKELQKTTGKKSLGIRKEDKVKVMRGALKGKTGKVLRVNRDKEQIFIEKLIRKKSDGTEVLIPVHPSNVMITELKHDEKRVKKKKKKEQVK